MFILTEPLCYMPRMPTCAVPDVQLFQIEIIFYLLALYLRQCKYIKNVIGVPPILLNHVVLLLVCTCLHGCENKRL